MSKLEELIQQYCPDGVEYHCLNDVAAIKRGERVTKAQLIANGQYPVISGGVKPLGNLDRYNREANTITIAQYGTAGYVDWQNSQFWANDVCYSVFPSKIVSNRFLYYVLLQNQELLYSLKTNAIPACLPLDKLTSIEIPVPPLPVQEEIVRILDTFTELQAELQAELQKRLQQYSYYRDNLLSFEGRTDVEWKRLGDVCQKTDNIKWKSTTGTHQYIDLSSVDIQTHSILSTTEIDKESAPSRAQQIVKQDDVIFATTRPTQMRVCLIPSSYDGEICSTGYCVLRPEPSIILPKYLFFVLAVEDFKVYLSNNLTMGNYPSISNSTLKEYELPIPSLAEQQRIVDILDRFDSLTNDLTQGLPAEIEKRKQQYEYYRDKLLTFKRQEA